MLKNILFSSSNTSLSFEYINMIDFWLLGLTMIETQNIISKNLVK